MVRKNPNMEDTMRYKLSDTYKSMTFEIEEESYAQRQIRKRGVRKQIIRLSHAKYNSKKQKEWIGRLIMCQINLLEHLKELDNMGYNK